MGACWKLSTYKFHLSVQQANEEHMMGSLKAYNQQQLFI